MTDRFLLYGATGYTGKLIAAAAREWHLEPILAGRDPNKVRTLAEQTGFDHRVFSLTETGKMEEALNNVDVVVHAAGPFSDTAVPMLKACLHTNTHYLDITGEIDVFETLARHHEAAKAADIMVLPGVGFDVVPSDCLAAHVAHRLPGANKITLAISALVNASRGTLKTMMENIHIGARIRKNGEIKEVDTRLAEFDFGNGPEPGVTVAWGDVSTAYYSTGIGNVEVYFRANAAIKNVVAFGKYFGWLSKTAPMQLLLKSLIELQPAGPTIEDRESKQTTLIGIAEDTKGNRALSRMKAPEGYKLTYLTTLAITQKVLAGHVSPGFQTPSLAYGADFILEIEGVSREDL